MKYLHLVWAQLTRSRTRTLLTAFLLFGLLDTVRVVFNSVTNTDNGARAGRVEGPS